VAKYIYYTATGPVEIEIDGYWAVQLAAEDADERNAERKQKRPDRKYAPGVPISINSYQFEGFWIADRSDAYREVVFSLDLKNALRHLNELQRRYFILNRILGYSFAEIARHEGRPRWAVYDNVRAAEKKLKKHFM